MGIFGPRPEPMGMHGNIPDSRMETREWNIPIPTQNSMCVYEKPISGVQPVIVSIFLVFILAGVHLEAWGGFKHSLSPGFGP